MCEYNPATGEHRSCYGPEGKPWTADWVVGKAATKAKTFRKEDLLREGPAMLKLLEEAMDSRAPDYADVAYPGWHGRASDLIARLRA